MHRFAEESPPDVSSALNRVLSSVAWVEQGRLRTFSNVALAEAAGQILGSRMTHSHIAKIRQGVTPDPRGSVVWAIGRVLSTRAVVEITPDYFYVPATRARVDRELDLELERVTTELRRGPRHATG